MTRFKPRQPHAPTGFTLIELLMAMFILALGLVGVVSVFPVSAYLQREALGQVTTSTMTDNVRSLIIARKIDSGDLPSSPTGNVEPISSTALDSGDWPLALRTGNDGFFWVPLARDAAGGGTGDRDWEIYVFILARQGDGTYEAQGNELANGDDPVEVPKVVKYDNLNQTDNQIEVTLPNPDSGLTIFEAGDQFLTQDGRIMTVATKVPNTEKPTITVANDDPGTINAIWCAPYAPGKSRGPTLRILAFGSEAVK